MAGEVFSQQILMATQSACSMRHRLQLRNYFIVATLHFIILLLKSANLALKPVLSSRNYDRNWHKFLSQ